MSNHIADIIPDYSTEGFDSGKDIILPDTIAPSEFVVGDGKAIESQSALDDFKFARDTIHGLVANGQVALQEMMKVAMLSDSARAYEVVATMIKTVGDSTKDMLALQEKMLDLQQKAGTNNLTIQNTEEKSDVAFTGSAAELLEDLEFEEYEENEENK